MPHPLVIGLFNTPSDAVAAARALRDLGIAHERVSIVARTHEEEGEIASASGGSPGSELEDSAAAARIGELSAHFLSAIALVMPGIGPIVADGPLAADLAEVAGHTVGGFARRLAEGGLTHDEAQEWQARIHGGSIAVGAHVEPGGVTAAREALSAHRPVGLADLVWE